MGETDQGKTGKGQQGNFGEKEFSGFVAKRRAREGNEDSLKRFSSSGILVENFEFYYFLVSSKKKNKYLLELKLTKVTNGMNFSQRRRRKKLYFMEKKCLLIIEYI